MPLIDLTVPLCEGMPVWPGDPAPRLRYERSFGAGDKNNVSSVAMGLHTGTHMDAPKHFISGSGGMETLPLDTLIGPARVIEIENPDRVEAEELRGKNIGGATRLLIKTRNSAARWWEKSFDPDFCHMTEEAARVLLDAGMKLLGVDCLSVDGYAAGAAPVHNLLLPAGVVLLEGLNLSDAPPGRLRAFRAARPFRGPGRGPGKSGVEDYLAFRREFSIGLSTQ